MTGNMRHPIVIRWQQIGQPSSAIATPHFNDRTSTKRAAIAAAVAMADLCPASAATSEYSVAFPALTQSDRGMMIQS